ncbi:AraC family transcriptional regulator [Cohnella ginsengisoli]|uniref:AraC family transcriptional regulator n=1 Tax=Cohnella ginsengisoli TaxID=425004 RepID=A0A9X4KFD3_9BACL|nr:AraC family transcriptional regulator [Cohnella ginsengisoli]MDG0790930.1 AraC family transcriptional regulator [Cohnella ginsengisoli]
MAFLLKGDSFFEPDFPVFLNREPETFATAMHTHDFIELAFVTEGRGFHYVDGECLAVQKGDLFLLPIGTAHVFRPSSSDPASPLVVMNCIFDPSVSGTLRSWIPEDSELQHFLTGEPAGRLNWYRCSDEGDQFRTLFNQALLEYTERSSGYRRMVTATLLQMLLQLHRVQTRAPQPAASFSPDIVEEALLFIEKHYSDKITLKAFADRAYVSVGHFQNQFKKATGQTFNHYLQNVRIEKCCKLLKTTDKTVQETANEVGYSDMKFFHSLFRKITGSSPQRYRRA